jgi:hypothetical protein
MGQHRLAWYLATWIAGAAIYLLLGFFLVSLIPYLILPAGFERDHEAIYAVIVYAMVALQVALFFVSSYTLSLQASLAPKVAVLSLTILAVILTVPWVLYISAAIES